MKKIGIVVSTLGLGGNERSAINIFFSLKEIYETMLITFDGSDYQKTELSAEDFIDLKTPASNYFLVKVIHTISRIWKIKRIIKKEKLDLLFLITNENTFLTRVKIRKAIKVISCRDCGHLISNTLQFKKNLDKSSFMICNSEYMKNYYLSFYPEDSGKVEYIYNILNFELIERMASDPLPNDADRFFQSHSVICSVGRVCEEKGFNHLLRVFELARREKKDLGLCIVGDGPLMNSIRSMLDNSRFAKDVMLVGFDNNPFKYIKASKLFVLSSISEGFPNVLIEAMSVGVPIISTNCKSGPSEIINPSNRFLSFSEGFMICDYGILTEPFSNSNDYKYDTFCPEEVAMSKAILELLNNDSLANSYKGKSLLGIERFLRKNVVLKYQNVFNQLMMRGNKNETL